ncbi:MAG: (1-_4)-alpha-D-glucan 1-alpha-D-glucosylmutase [Actinomycetota bacterium]
MPSVRRAPAAAATYRLQLRPEFGFADAAAAVPYLSDLGVTHLYLSPIFEAAHGSTHGYDVVDPTRLRDELGGTAGFDALVAAAHAADLCVVLDVVPNHMAATEENRWWRDVMAAGEAAPSAGVFDVDWVAGDGAVRRGPPRDQINYRRFFEIDDLAAVRQEDPQVFDATHSLVRALAARPGVDGLRVDHVDGLRDPTAYLQRLADAAPNAWLAVEKILEPGEQLRAEWPVVGTTGYEFASQVLGLFLDPAAAPVFADIYVRLTGDERAWPDAVAAGKRYALGAGLVTDVRRVARAFGDAALETVITELAVAWPVYRTYTTPGHASAEDLEIVRTTCDRVRAARPDLADSVARVERALRREGNDASADEGADRFQLLTGPAMAKGVEDRAFYDFTRFVALNEVGGDPDRFGTSVEEWHAACEATAEQWPATMLTTATHDTKRGEDVRTRLAVISERADWWGEHAAQWMGRHDSIDGPTAYLLLQTLVGAWPLSEERLSAYMQKATREAGAHTSWAAPDDAYESAVAAEVRAALGETDAIAAMVAPLVEPGRVNSLAQTLLRLTAPGTPDTYQGTEGWDLSLVDPDNRRPVHYDVRSQMLHAARAATAEELLARADEAWAKVDVIATALSVRRSHPHAFTGDYQALECESDALVAFAREDAVVTVVPRLVASTRPQGKVELPNGEWVNQFTGDTINGGQVDAGELLARFPVALLTR